MFTYIILIAGAAWFIYSLINKPEWIAILLFTSIIADINFDLPGMPLNFRAFVSLALLVKVLTDSAVLPGPKFLETSYSKYIIGFVLYVLFVTYQGGLLTPDIVKEYFWSVVCAYLGYYFYMREGGYKIFKISIVIAGFSCLGDLAWTYVQGGGLWIQRIYFSFTPSFAIFNHNFFGYICALAFVFLLSDYLTDNGNTKLNLWGIPFMFLGVLLSTSRSSLLMLIIISIVLIARGLASKKSGKKAYKLVLVTVGCLVIAMFMFQIMTTVFSMESEFLEQITARMIDEPVAIFNRAMGNEFKAESLDSMDWRAEASQIAYNVFTNILDPSEQIFGIGHEGFMARKYGYDGIYDAHNGVLLMFIEFGIIGAIIYSSLLLSFFLRYRTAKIFSPLLVMMIFIILYITSHNRELTSIFVFLITGTMAGELEYKTYRETVPEEEEMPEISNESLET